MSSRAHHACSKWSCWSRPGPRRPSPGTSPTAGGSSATLVRADGGIRTHDPRFTRAVLWPAELRRRDRGASLASVGPSPGVFVDVAATFRRRLLGLAWSRPPRAEALFFPRCRSVHTFGMRFALDLFWLDADGHVVRIDRAVPPRRVVWCRAAAGGVIEVPSRASRPVAAVAASAP